MKITVLSLLLLLLFSASGNAATFDPSFNFTRIETKHFTVYFHQGLEEIANRAAVTAEEVHAKLTLTLQWEPAEKTHLVIADNSDFANGMTTAVPYNAIYLQTAPPSRSSSVGEYDNWLRTLIVHEYAHVLTSDPVRGYSLTMRRIFGKPVPFSDLLSLLTFVAIGPPNIMMPRWWHEGVATWAETELTSSGRGRSSYYQMLYRTAVAENNLPGIDKINGEVPYWPAGNSPYIFGSALIQHIAETYGKDLPGSISRAQSGYFPYFINRAPAKELNSSDYPALYREMLDRMISEQTKKIETLKQEPFTTTTRISKLSVSETNPRYSPDGSMLAFNRNDRHSHPVIVIHNRNGRELANFRRIGGDGNIAWAPDSAGIIFSQAELSRESNYYQDLYRYDLKKQTVKRLSREMRAADPDISPDGSSIVAVINSRGTQNIGLMNLEALLEENSGNIQKLLTDFQESRVSPPKWSPDGRSIVFALTDRNGSTSLQLLNLGASSSKELLKNGSSIDSPTWSADGTEIFFSSDLSGVFNIFRYNPASGKTTQVTHLLSGAFTPDISRADQTLAIGEYSSFGPTVATIAKENYRTGSAPSPAIRFNLYPVNSTMLESAPAEAVPVPATPAPYSPVPTLLPAFWLPTLFPETAADTAYGAMTGGQDVLGYHSYLAKVMYGTGFKKGYFDTVYQYNRYIPTFTLHGYALPSTYANLITTGDFTEIEKGLSAAASYPLTRIESKLSLTAGYHLRSQKPLTGGALKAANNRPLFQGRRDSFFAGIDFNDALKYPWSITREEGRHIAFNFNYYGKESGSELAAREYTAFWEEHIPLGSNHTIFTQIHGGFADGTQSAQQSFQLGGTTSFLNPFGLRGYDSHFTSGSRIVTGTLEYRLPLSYLLHGFDTKPLFADRLHGALFVDGGESWDQDHSFKGSRILTGTGIELRLDLTLGYWLKITPALGYAHGFDKPYGTDQIYFNIYANL